MIRAGLRSRGWFLVALGALVLGAYGVVLNLLPIDFSKLLGAYVAFFALAGIAVGRIAFREQISASTWIGVTVVFVGSAIVQYGAR